MKTLIIAEASVNHNGSLKTAYELIDIAKNAGADAVKFQTFCTDQLLTKTAPKAAYQRKNTASNETQYAMLKNLELSYADHHALIAHCKMREIQFLSTPFDLASLTFLTHDLNLPIIKIASGEITNSPLLFTAGKTGKKVILSTGMTTLADIEFALTQLVCGYLNYSLNELNQSVGLDAYRSSKGQEILQQKVSLLHCVTNYPADYQEVNLKALDTLRHAFNLAIGYSDHTLGIHIPIAAVARGATIIEKHFTLDRRQCGPDHAASLEPDELKTMISAIRQVEEALGDGRKLPTTGEIENLDVVRKSLVTLKKIARGEAFNEHNLGLKRPGGGISGKRYLEWLGKRASKDYDEGEWIIE